MLIGIITAMDMEADMLRELMNDARAERISSIDFYRGQLSGRETVAAVAGVGKVNAAVCAQTMILKYSPDIIINVGIAGGLADGLKIGDVAVADRVAEHDMDTTPLGDKKGFIAGINMVYMPCDEAVSALMTEAADKAGLNVLRGTIASGDQFIASGEQRGRIVREFGAVAAEMEGAAIGHVCVMNNVRFGVLRAISDGANDGSSTDYSEFAPMAAANSAKIILEMLKML